MSSPPVASLDIANLALDRLGQQPIANLVTPDGPTADICARWYDQTRREMLRKYIFNFARKTALLTTDAEAPTHPEFANGYSLPVDFIRLLTLGDRVLYGGAIPSVFFDFSAGYLYCDDHTIQGSSSNLQINYTFDAQTVGKFDPLFVKVLALQMAVNMAKQITKKDAPDKLLTELKDADLAAAAVAGQEKPPRRVQRSRLRDVRRSGGIFRNNTLIGFGNP